MILKKIIVLCVLMSGSLAVQAQTIRDFHSQLQAQTILPVGNFQEVCMNLQQEVFRTAYARDSHADLQVWLQRLDQVGTPSPYFSAAELKTLAESIYSRPKVSAGTWANWYTQMCIHLYTHQPLPKGLVSPLATPAAATPDSPAKDPKKQSASSSSSAVNTSKPSKKDTILAPDLVTRQERLEQCRTAMAILTVTKNAQAQHKNRAETHAIVQSVPDKPGRMRAMQAAVDDAYNHPDWSLDRLVIKAAERCTVGSNLPAITALEYYDKWASDE